VQLPVLVVAVVVVKDLTMVAPAAAVEAAAHLQDGLQLQEPQTLALAVAVENKAYQVLMEVLVLLF
jgi:hypothetical protein